MFAFIKTLILLIVISTTCLVMFFNLDFLQQGFLISLIASVVNSASINIYHLKNKYSLILSAYLSVAFGILLQSFLASHSFSSYGFIDFLIFYSVFGLIPTTVWSLVSTFIIISLRKSDR